MDDSRQNLSEFSSPNQLLPIDEELWQMAEERAQEVLCTIQPNILSEVNRKDVIDYVQRLIRGYCGTEVFPFGSVPLKTYLPDGDVDLTALSHENAEEDLAQAVCSILESGDDPEYQVKDIQYIRAQVQLVKCTVKNLAVDISFNQMAGLYTLRFLEQVDQLVGKNHILKRSIILIKAWCYYESRILGAHHGLLSTYALETLVLYIFNRFHSTLRGPLEVLYRFLDYYGRFDWDQYYVSIDGPKPLSSLPEIVEMPDCDRGEFLLQKEFLKNYRDLCSFSARASETMTHEFPTKFMNILDPLRDDNNLGRSVNRANLHRIRFALLFGARRLKQILKLPGVNMGRALERFFKNTLDRNGKGERPDVDVPVPAFGTGKSEESVLCGDCESYYGGLQYIQLYRNCAMPVTANHSSPSSPSQADILASSAQQNWSLYYQRGTDVYVPGQTFYHPNVSQANYSLEEREKSRGTGTYIPDMAHNSYWNIRLKVSRPRRLPSGNHNAWPKSPPKNQQVEEIPSETDMNGNSKPFELSSEDFPLLPTIGKTIPSEVQECGQLVEVHSETDIDGNSRLINLSNEDFPLVPTTPKTILSEVEECTQLVELHSGVDGNSRLFELSNEDFPLLPITHKTFPSEAQECAQLVEVHSVTDMDGGNTRSFELSREDFPLLPNTCKTMPSEAQDSAPLLTKQAKSSLSSQLNIEFGTYRTLPSPTEPGLSTKDEKEDSGVSASQDTMERKEESPEGEEKMD